VERRGKHQLIHLEDGRVIHAHFRLNGDWVIGSSDDELPRFARAVFHFTSGTALFWRTHVRSRRSMFMRLTPRSRSTWGRSRRIPRSPQRAFARRSSAAAFPSRWLCSIKGSSPAWETSTRQKRCGARRSIREPVPTRSINHKAGDCSPQFAR